MLRNPIFYLLVAILSAIGITSCLPYITQKPVEVVEVQEDAVEVFTYVGYECGGIIASDEAGGLHVFPYDSIPTVAGDSLFVTFGQDSTGATVFNRINY